MRFSINTYKRISCLLLLVMYISFLCFQVSYNLEIGRTIQRACKLNNTWQLTENGNRVAAHSKHTLITKVKTAPSKRFHFNIASIEPQLVSVPVIAYAKNIPAVYSAPFVAKTFDQTSPLRGPPAA